MPNCVIVDAFGPGMFFLPVLQKKGYNIIHIQSALNIPQPFLEAINNAAFFDRLVYQGDIEALINSLNQHDPISFVIPGFETGVKLADILSERLSLKSNGTLLSNARRNKYEMIEALRKKNIAAVKHIKTNRLEHGLEWVHKNTNFPVILKPIDSASSEDVYICNNENDFKHAFAIILNKINFMNSVNDEVLIQSYINGTEFVVNSVSCNGAHYITDIWVCKKRVVNNRIIYDKEELIKSEGERQKTLTNYAYSVLNALGIEHGPAHSEIILTERGPILLETGARLGGAVHPDIHSSCIGHSQVELTVDAYCDEKSFYEKTKYPYTISKYLYVVMLISEQEGVIEEIPLLNDLKKLPTLCSFRLKKKIGDKLLKTVDLSSSPATVYLASTNKESLDEDYEHLLSLTKTGFTLKLN